MASKDTAFRPAGVFRRFLKPGERVGLVGRNGAGKSTLLNEAFHSGTV